MENISCRSAIRTDRALTAVHGGALLGLRTRTAATKQAPMGLSFVVAVPAYVVDQESHSPRGSTG